NSFIGIEVDRGSEASHKWARASQGAQTEPPRSAYWPSSEEAEITKMQVTTWLDQLKVVKGKMIPAVVKELSQPVRKVSDDDQELQEIKRQAIDAVKGVLDTGRLACYDARWEVMYTLCEMMGAPFARLKLEESDSELQALQASVWVEWLSWMDEKRWLQEQLENPEQVVQDTMDMGSRASGRVNASVMKAVQKLICNFAKKFSDGFVKKTGDWFLQQIRRLYDDQWGVVVEHGIRGFCTLFRYKEHREMFSVSLVGNRNSVGECFREDVEKLIEEMQAMQMEQEDRCFDSINRLLVYTHPLIEIAGRIDASAEGAAPELKGIFGFEGSTG
ncbi:unnamed protein product, partial [Symbiodinium pilosum]